LTGQCQLPSTEQELHEQSEKRAQKEYMKQHTTSDAAANRAAAQQAEAEKDALEAAKATHLAQSARTSTLAAGATIEQAETEAEKAAADALG